jgi:ABC-type proline/glycine betaine transport system ATPase subunit
LLGSPGEESADFPAAELLLLDEPFSALDPPTREALLFDLESILRETGVTTVFVTHDRNEAFMFGDRAAVLIGGKLRQLGATAEVFAQPINEEVAGFVGVDTRIHGAAHPLSSSRRYYLESAERRGR